MIECSDLSGVIKTMLSDEKKQFHCVSCGECCRHIHLIEGLKHLQTNGICKFLVDNKCAIYATRPSLCQYEAVYKIFKDKMSLKEYDAMAMYYCQQLQDFKKEQEKED